MRQKIGAFCGVLQQHDRARQPANMRFAQAAVLAFRVLRQSMRTAR